MIRSVGRSPLEVLAWSGHNAPPVALFASTSRWRDVMVASVPYHLNSSHNLVISGAMSPRAPISEGDRHHANPTVKTSP
jgi:hypothetical protein